MRHDYQKYEQSAAGHELDSMIRAELQPSETITWTAGPNPRRMARKAWFLVLFGIPWTGFAIFWMIGAAGFKLPDFSSGEGIAHVCFSLFGLPFVLIGLAMLSAPYWAARKAAATAYVITNRRVILFVSGWRGGMKIRSLLPPQFTNIRRVQFADGSGDLILCQHATTDSDGRPNMTNVGFWAIPDVKMAESLVLALANSASPPIHATHNAIHRGTSVHPRRSALDDSWG